MGELLAETLLLLLISDRCQGFLSQKAEFLLTSGLHESPEDLSREKIDALREQCGWIIQNRSTINLSAGAESRFERGC
jgi:hypothetical protein